MLLWTNVAGLLMIAGVNDSIFQGEGSRRHFLGIAALACTSVRRMTRAAEATMRRIGFVDDNLENYHANVFLQALRGPLRDRGFAVSGCTSLKQAEGRAWAAKNKVPWFESASQLNSAVDFYMVLAPSTPETHLALCEQVLPHGKATYVDKTFAPDVGTARRIFALADKHSTPMQTTSALRYTNIQNDLKKGSPSKVEHVITWGGGSSFGEYAIHPVELLISIMGPEVTALMRRGTEQRSQLLLNFAGGRTGVVNVYTQSNTPFAASLTSDKATRYQGVDAGQIFVNNMAAILDFFEAGKPNVDRRESLAIMRILEAARDPQALERFISLGE